jgi:GT2 family glycosyltransferase
MGLDRSDDCSKRARGVPGSDDGSRFYPGGGGQFSARSNQIEMDEPKVFVIILNWNLKDDTIACVDSVLASGYAGQQIVVVDNGSQDGSVQALTSRYGDTLYLIAHEENLGFARGVNAGIRHALSQGADWILLLNNDTVIAPDMVERLITAADCQPDAGILAPAIFYYDQPDVVWRLGDRHHRWLPIPTKVPPEEIETQEVLSVDYVTGCGMLVRREVFSVIGLFDPQYFMYYEDADFCRRAAKAGFSILCVAGARIWHKVSRSSHRHVGRLRYLRTRYRVQFYRQHFAFPAWGYLFLSTTWVVLKDLFRGDIPSARASARGFYHGWRPDIADHPV